MRREFQRLILVADFEFPFVRNANFCIYPRKRVDMAVFLKDKLRNIVSS